MREPLRGQVGRGLFLFGGLLLILCLGAILDANGFQERLRRRLEALRAPRASPSTLSRAEATRREARASGLIGRLDIGRLGVSVMVIEGTNSQALRRGVGHVEGSAFPGEKGNVALAGHRDSYFRPLRKIESGDRITLRTPDGRFVYEVDSAMVVSPRRGDVLRRGHSKRLTLVTCYPFYYVGPAPRRFVVVAHAVEEDARLAVKPANRKHGSIYVAASAMR